MRNTSIAKTPPMGWNSFDCFGWSVNEREVLENAEYMAKNLLPFGWNTVVVDFIWAMPGASDDPNPHQTSDFEPRLNMDEFGRLLPAEDRFPSSRGGLGFRPLSDRVHSMGLKFGIHIMRGIPRQAVSVNARICDSNARAADIADTNSVCPWLNHMYGLNMSADGAQEYIDSLFALYTDWGVDYIKIDDLSYPYYAREIEGYSQAAANCGRDMVVSTSPGETPLSRGSHIREHANMWRVSGDFWDEWRALKAQFKRLDDWSAYRSEGCWPDADMLPLGRICLRGPMGSARRTRFSPIEQRTLMTLWAMARSPLMLGANMPDLTKEELELLTNERVLCINQHSTGNAAVRTTDTDAVWRASLGDKEAAALFNLSDVDALVSVNVNDVFMQKRSGALDPWTGEREQLGDRIACKLRPHESKLLIAE